MERLFLIDGMAVAYRAYFAFISRPLINSKGMNTSAIFGFTAALDKILVDERPEHVAVAFDTKEPTFRHKRYPAYKATREKMPDDMVEQLPYLKQIVQAYRIPVIELPGWEADDVIGTLARRADAEGLACFMVTPDKDYMQLVTEHVKIYRPGKATDTYEIIDIDGVRERFGVTPAQVPDVLGLMGDASDNIPGVKGVGEKTAIPLIQQFGSVAALYERLGEVSKPGLRAKLAENRDMAFLSRELVTIDTDAPVDIDPENLRASPKDFDTLRALFTELELRRFLQRVDEEQRGTGPAPSPLSSSSEPAGADGHDAEAHEAAQNAQPAVSSLGLASAATVPHEYVTVTSDEQLAEMVRAVSEAEEFCFDTETTGVDPLRAELVGLSFAVRAQHAWYVPMNAALAPQAILNAVRPLFAGNARLVGQNLKFDLLALRQAGVESAQPLYDTMLAAYILRPEGDHSMDGLALQLLHYQPIPIERLIGKGRGQLSMADVPLQDISAYAAEDADVTLQIAHALRPEIARTGQERLLGDVEFPLVHVLAAMEHEGVRIDTAALGDIAREMQEQIDRATSEIHVMAGAPFNIGSTKQLGEVLFTRLGLPSGRKTKTGYSTDAAVLDSLLGRHPIIEQILLHRQLTKLKSTYVDALPRLVHPRTGRVHTTYNQAVAATGRLSSTDPNLQNIPIRTEAGREVRRAFVACDAGYVLLSADYSQIELRLAAEIAGDEALAAAFASGEDIHASTAMRLFDVPAEGVTAELRRRAKTVNFGILYGISAFGLAQRLGIPNNDAKELIDLYFEKYPRISDYLVRTVAFAQAHGFVETLLGRRRYIPDINNRNRNVRMFAERTAINAPIQGSAADMIKLAMVRIHADMRAQGFRSRMILQVHDELVFDARRDEVEDLRALVVDRMRTALPVNVPIEVDAGIGDNWLEAH
jgi:DNA polymerase I